MPSGYPIPKIKKICLVCKKEFLVEPRYLGKYCSQKCYHQSIIGKKQSKETIAKRIKNITGKFGKNGMNWKGGRYISDSYIMVYYKNENGKTIYIPEHRLIMEKHLGRPLTKFEYVHHINAIKTDNRIKNLIIVNLKNHYGKTTCPFCLKEFLIK